MKTSLKMLLSFALMISFMHVSAQQKLHKKLSKYCSTLSTEFTQITEDRKKELREIGDYILEKRKEKSIAKVLFICTHNSRRSQMGQVWFQTAAAYYGIDSIVPFSGGTEATAFNKRAADALSRAGFKVAASSAVIAPQPVTTDYTGTSKTTNPFYEITYGKRVAPMMLYSKKYDDLINPKSGFLAIMVCSEADKTCPDVKGAELRIAMPYDDPKYYDDTPSEKAKYDERCRQIAREQFFIMDYVKQKLILLSEAAKQ